MSLGQVLRTNTAPRSVDQDMPTYTEHDSYLPFWAMQKPKLLVDFCQRFSNVSEHRYTLQAEATPSQNGKL
jgi:hypothetical protein